MRLTLELISSEFASSVRPAIKHFSNGGGLIGRSGDAALQIEHPGVSRHHAMVVVLNEMFFIEDNKSTNGVLVGSNRLEPGIPYSLATGDIVQVDVFRFRVSISAKHQAGEADRYDGHFDDGHHRDARNTSTNTQRPGNGFHAQHSPAALLDDGTEDPLDLIGASDSAELGLDDDLSELAAEFARGRGDVSELIGAPLPSSSSARPSRGAALGAPSSGIVNDLLDESFQPPATTHTNASSVLSELDDEEGWGLPSTTNPPDLSGHHTAAAQLMGASHQSSKVRDTGALSGPEAFATDLPPPRPPVNPTTHTATPPMIIKDHTNGVAPAMATANDKGVGNAHGVHQATVTAVNRPADTPMNVPVETDAVMRAFREALGVPDLRLDEDSAAELGGMVRSLLDGMMELLRAQSEIKAEFRLPVTRMKRQGNNPFKFSPRSEEALVALFLRRSAAYLAPTEAVDEALADLRAHQLAMIGGLRDAYAQLLNTLSAKALESRFGGETKDSLFSSRASRESQLWKSYAALIEDWREHIGDSFIQNFGQDFAEAYEGHVDAARRARKEGGDAY